MAEKGRIAGFFPIRGTDGGYVVAEWHPDPLVMEKDIIQMANDFDDWAVPLEEARELMIEETRVHFETETDYKGHEWTPLDPVYAFDKKKRGEGERILYRDGSGALEAAATSEEAWFIDERSISFNVGALPPYGVYHQDGSGPKGTTAYHKLIRNTEVVDGKPMFKGRELSDRESKFIAGFQTGEGSGNSLPARPFIGISEYTIGLITRAFIKHIENTIEKPWKDMGGPIDLGVEGPRIGDVGFFSGGQGTIISFTKRGQPILRTSRGVRFGRR